MAASRFEYDVSEESVAGLDLCLYRVATYGPAAVVIPRGKVSPIA